MCGTVLGLVAALMGGTALSQARDQLMPEVDPQFRPVLVSVDFTTRHARPGDLIGLTYRFRNDGTAPAAQDYMVFVHLEWPDRGCGNIVVNLDHPPLRGTSTWEPGEVVSDGPYVLRAPAEKGEAVYHVHVGLYAPQLPGGPRLLDVYAGELRVDRNAPPTEVVEPASLAPAELTARRKNLAARIRDGVSLDTQAWRFTLDRQSGAWQLLDKSSGVLWTSNPEQAVFGSVTLTDGTTVRSFAIRRFDEIARTASGLRLVVRPKAGNEDTGLMIAFDLRPVADPSGLEISYSVRGESKWKVASVTTLDRALWTTEADAGYSVLPVRLGLLAPAGQGLPVARRMLTYSDTSMAFYGAVKQGSALLVAWPHCDTELLFTHTWPDNPLVAGRQMNSISLTLFPPANSCTIYPLG
ncbi:MAG: hypothetical protein H5T86_15790, partial [Armatimonadetes bacterium]|nr:hypothetical protein [Armatimonadota bacterium]